MSKIEKNKIVVSEATVTNKFGKYNLRGNLRRAVEQKICLENNEDDDDYPLRNIMKRNYYAYKQAAKTTDTPDSIKGKKEKPMFQKRTKRKRKREANGPGYVSPTESEVECEHELTKLLKETGHSFYENMKNE